MRTSKPARIEACFRKQVHSGLALAEAAASDRLFHGTRIAGHTLFGCALNLDVGAL